MIQRILFLSIAVLFIASCTNQSKQGISGVVEGAENQTIYFEKYVDNKPQPVDSATIDSEGSFYLDETGNLPMNYYRLRVGDDKTLIMLTDSTESVYIETDLENFDIPEKIKGSKNTVLLRDFNRLTSKGFPGRTNIE